MLFGFKRVTFRGREVQPCIETPITPAASESLTDPVTCHVLLLTRDNLVGPKLGHRPCGLLVSLTYGIQQFSHIKGYISLCSYAQWYCKWVSAAV